MSEQDPDAQPIGAALDALGMTLNLSPNHQLVDAVVIGRTVNFAAEPGHGKIGLMISLSEGLDWISEMGLLTAAQAVLNESAGAAGYDECDEDDDGDDDLDDHAYVSTR